MKGGLGGMGDWERMGIEIGVQNVEKLFKINKDIKNNLIKFE